MGTGSDGMIPMDQAPAEPSRARERIRITCIGTIRQSVALRAGVLNAMTLSGRRADGDAGLHRRGLVSAQSNGQRITPHFRDAEIGQVIEAVAPATGKTIIPDSRVRAQVTMLSTTPMTPDSSTRHSWGCCRSTNSLPWNRRHHPHRSRCQRAPTGQPGPARTCNGGSEQLVTQVIAVKNVNASQLVPVLRPLQPQSAHLAAYPSSNILIISDRASNVSRILRIIERIDQVGDTDVDIVRLEHASSAEVVRVVNTFFQQAAAEGGGRPTRVIADDRSNSVLVGGDKSQRLRIKALVAHLDTPLDHGGDTQVRLSAVRGRREDRHQAEGTDQCHRGHYRRRLRPAGARGGGVAASADGPRPSGPSPRPMRW